MNDNDGEQIGRELAEKLRHIHESFLRSHKEQEEADTGFQQVMMREQNSPATLRAFAPIVKEQAARKAEDFAVGDLVLIHSLLNTFTRYDGPYLVTQILDKEYRHLFVDTDVQHDTYGDVRSVRLGHFNENMSIFFQIWADPRRLIKYTE